MSRPPRSKGVRSPVRIVAIKAMRVPPTRRATWASTEALARSSQFTSSSTARTGSAGATAVRSLSVAIATATSSSASVDEAEGNAQGAPVNLIEVVQPAEHRPQELAQPGKLSAASNSVPAARSTRTPRRLASAASSLINAVFPTPASPVSNRAPPSSAAAMNVRRSERSRSRRTNAWDAVGTTDFLAVDPTLRRPPTGGNRLMRAPLSSSAVVPPARRSVPNRQPRAGRSGLRDALTTFAPAASQGPRRHRIWAVGRNIADGLVGLFLLAPICRQLLPVRGAESQVSYGFDRVRIPAPLPGAGGVAGTSRDRGDRRDRGRRPDQPAGQARGEGSTSRPWSPSA